MSDTSPRLALPLLQAGQAQKEIYHNEALLRLDALVQPIVEAVGRDDPPPAPAVGQCWILGGAPSGAWAGQPGAIAFWSEGGWRFVDPREGMTFWSAADGVAVRRGSGGWEIGTTSAARLVIDGLQVVGRRREAVPDPSGGTTIDAEARATIGAILEAMRLHGLIAQ